MAQQDSSSSSEPENSDEQEQIRIARALVNYRLKEKMDMRNTGGSGPSLPFQKKFSIPHPRPSSPQQRLPTATSKILPLFCPKTAPRNRQSSTAANDMPIPIPQPRAPSPSPASDNHPILAPRFPTMEAPHPYVPVRQYRPPYKGIAPPVTIRTAVPVYSAPPSSTCQPRIIQPRPVKIAPPVRIRQAIPAFSAPPPVPKVASTTATLAPILPEKPPAHSEEDGIKESTALKCLEHLEI